MFKKYHYGDDRRSYRIYNENSFNFGLEAKVNDVLIGKSFPNIFIRKSEQDSWKEIDRLSIDYHRYWRLYKKYVYKNF